MSWTDIFTVLDDEMMDAYRAGATDVEREEFEEWFGVGKTTQDGKTQDAREEGVARSNGFDGHRSTLHFITDAAHFPIP